MGNGHNRKSFRRAIETRAEQLAAYSDMTINVLMPLGRIEEGVHEMQIAEKTDPLSPQVQFVFSSALSAGRYEEAAGHRQKARADIECLGRVRSAQGRIDEAIQILATVNTQYLGYAFGRAGRREEAEKLAAAAAPNAFTQAL